LCAAKQHFLQHGFDRASLDAIAASADVSKLTIYSHFGNKDELFKAVIAAKCNESKLRDDYESLKTLPVRDAMMNIATRFADMIFMQESVDMHRTIIAEAAIKPKISELMYDAGPKPAKASLADFLKFQHKKGALTIPDANAATRHFFCLLKGEKHFKMLMNLEGLPSPKEKAAHVKDCVELFLRGYAPHVKKK
jgi:TetR/AcrR family transcriptional repressor of mexJK operon